MLLWMMNLTTSSEGNSNMAASNFDGFSGFSEADIQRMRDGTDNHKNGDSRPKKGDKKMPGKRKSTSKKVIVKDTAETSLNPDQMLSPPTRISVVETSEAKQVNLCTLDQNQTTTSASSGGRGQLSSPNGLVKLCLKSDGHSVEVVSGNINPTKPVELSTTRQLRAHLAATENGHQIVAEGESGDCQDVTNGCAPTAGKSKKLSLEEFQMRQKMIEEQNRKRRLMLTRAIADRKQKTLAETEKLTHIQKELQKLDSLVSNDVAILRDHIEVASMEFNEVQKRYEKAEREFVDAKIELFQKMERKEQLTEHLCTIIEQNEMRKAQKLADLMHELELDAVIENLQQEDPILPQLYALNDITYTYCTTPRDSKCQLSPPVQDKESHESFAGGHSTTHVCNTDCCHPLEQLAAGSNGVTDDCGMIESLVSSPQIDGSCLKIVKTVQREVDVNSGSQNVPNVVQ